MKLRLQVVLICREGPGESSATQNFRPLWTITNSVFIISESVQVVK